MPAEHGTAVPAGFTEVAAPPKPQAAVVKTKALEAPATSEAPAAAEATSEAPVEESKLAKAKKASELARKGAAKQRQLVAERDRLQQQTAYQAQQTQQLQGQLEQNQRYMQSLQSDPVGAMKQLGVPPEEIARRMAMEGSPEAKIAKLEERLLAQQAEIQRVLDLGKEAQEATRRDAIENEYKTEAANAKKYPNLQSVHPDFILSRTKELVLELRRKGHDPRQFSNHDLLSYLDQAYSKGVTAPEDEVVATPESPKKKTTTITNRMQTSTSAPPPDMSKMNDRQQRKWMAEQLRQSIGAK